MDPILPLRQQFKGREDKREKLGKNTKSALNTFVFNVICLLDS